MACCDRMGTLCPDNNLDSGTRETNPQAYMPTPSFKANFKDFAGEEGKNKGQKEKDKMK